jgi:EAL domain-containing protein (putative c-di-GMP-specific phosphodiesterase class I)
VVAEGIETSEQFEFLEVNECDEGQGHFIGMPRLATEIGPYLSSPSSKESSAA